MPSRWADSAEDAAKDARRKAEKEEKRRLRAEKQRREATALDAQSNDSTNLRTERPAKRRRLSQDIDERTTVGTQDQRQLLRFHAPTWQPCRSVERFERLNHIEEGSYGYVSRAREEASGEIVAIKKLKLNPTTDGGFPVTALREIQCLNAARHRHVVDLREVVVGSGTETGDVYLVMEFLEHDLKTLQIDMDEPFLPSEVKTLMLQLGGAVAFLHDHWILHRDLKTSNILMSNRGEIKVADFGMARVVGDPPPDDLTQLVVTLWYRAPELLLGTKTYDAAIDVWSLGCIFAELLTSKPLFAGKNEVDQLTKIFEVCGIPTESSWPGFRSLPNARALRIPSSQPATAHGSIVRAHFPTLTQAGAALLDSLLSLNPTQRPTAESFLKHSYFEENPRPKPTSMFPTFPSKAGQERRRRRGGDGEEQSPAAPIRGKEAPALQAGVDFGSIFKGREAEEKGGGFRLKLV